MQVLGIHCDQPYLRVALLKKTRKGWEIRCLKSTTCIEDVKPLYNASFKGKVVSALSGKNLLIRSMEVKGKKHRYFEKVLAFQAESTLHLDPKQVLTVPYLRKGKEALMLTASKEAIQEHLEAMGRWEVEPDGISIVPMGLVQYVRWRMPELSDVFIVHLGSSEWTCVWMEKGELKKAHSLSGGIEGLLAALWEDRKKILFQREVEGFAKQIDLLQLKEHLNPHLSGRLNEMRKELAKILYLFHEQGGKCPVLFTGRTDAFGKIREYLLESFKDFTLREYEKGVPTDEQKYEIAIGLGFETKGIQFRREEFFPEKNWTLTIRYLLALFCLSITLAAGVIVAERMRIQSRIEEMIASLESLLDCWDSSLKTTIFAQSQTTEEILNQWSQAVAAHAKEYPFILKAPRVSDVLDWLNRHPLLQKTMEEPVEVTSMHYQLTQFPTIDNPHLPFQAKVEILFETKSALNARKFHESLLNGDELVDATNEIKWDVAHEGYRVSFYLKNRGAHAL